MTGTLHQIWIFVPGVSLAVLAVLQAIDLALTLLHSLQERKGLLWHYFGAIAGVRIPDALGRIVFFGGLTLTLWAVGLAGIAGTVLWQTPLAFGTLGALIGCRVADSLFSHLVPYASGYRPNPGLRSMPLYLVEAAVLAVVFLPVLRAHPAAVATGLILGALAFYAVLPGLRLLGPLVFPGTERWQPGTPQPAW